MHFVASRSWWTVMLKDGGKVRIMVDSVHRSAESLRCDALVDASDEEQVAFTVAGTTPPNPRRARRGVR
jgi:hypothetical protein